jgi:hypothetical protein
MQAPDPELGLYCAPPHATHGPPSSPVNPALHGVAGAGVVASGVVVVGSGVVGSGVVVVVIIAQGPPVGPEYPSLHEQFCTDVLAAGEREFEGHGEQTRAPAAEYVPSSQPLHPSALSQAEDVPAAQSAQAPLPEASLYFPAAQETHVSTSSVRPAGQRQSATLVAPVAAVQAY